MAGKLYWREKIKTDLSNITTEQINFKSRLISQQLYDQLQKRQRQLGKKFILGVFFPFPSEPQWSCAFSNTIKDCATAFPSIVQERQMNFYLSKESDLVWQIQFGLKLKVPPPSSLAQEVIPDILFVPGLGFDREGNRLGRGKSYYDCYLKEFKGEKWGVCFSDQVFSQIPTEPHDQKVDLIFTEIEIIHPERPLPSEDKGVPI